MHAGWVALAITWLVGCSELERSHGDACAAVSVQALRGGAAEERYLALPIEQQSAVVAVYADTLLGAAPVCSAVLVSREHVLTARHCVEDALVDGTRLTIRFGQDAESPERIADVADVEAHPELDLALIVLSHAWPDDGFVASIGVRTRPLDRSIVGRYAAVSGYGLDDALLAGSRAFAVATIAELEEGSLSVSGVGSSGLCFGDSGGPLLARGEDGAVEVLGLLTAGSAACDGSDRFTRLDRAGAWLDALMGQVEPLGRVGCSDLGEAGRCFGPQAMRCAGDELVVERCGAPQACGWDAARSAFGCVAPAQDRCHGMAEIGRCTEARAESCEDGVVSTVECGACGLRCELSARTGRAQCVAVEE